MTSQQAAASDEARGEQPRFKSNRPRASRLSGKDVGSTTMRPLFIMTERFDARAGEAWHKYIAWSKLTQLTELVTLDASLCELVADEVLPDDWPHILNEDFMLHYFIDLDYLLRRCGGVEGRNLLCVFRNPEEQPTPPDGPHDFRFLGYDLIDVTSGPSALTNCGGFPLAFSNDELTSHGLLSTLARAREVQQALEHHYPDEHHAFCDAWAIFRATQHGAAADDRPQAGDRG